MLQLLHADEQLKGLRLCFQGTLSNYCTPNLLSSLLVPSDMRRQRGETAHPKYDGGRMPLV